MDNNETMKVLLVDDDRTCLLIVTAMLNKLKFQVVAVANPYDAMVTLRRRRDFDLVISDVHMPDFNGFQLQLIISQQFQLPVALMSGDNQEGILRQGMQNGALSFIRKPVVATDLKGLWRFVTSQKKSKLKGGGFMEMGGNRDNVNPGGIYLGISANSGTRTYSSCETTASTAKKKMVWTDPLHFKFLDAISSLGVENAVPKNILKAMNVPGLTRENVASHLQKYRQFLRRNIQEMENNLSNGGGYQPRFGPKRICRLAKLEQLFAQGQLEAAISSSPLTGRNNLDGRLNYAKEKQPLIQGHHASPNDAHLDVSLSKHDELLFYRGLERNSTVEDHPWNGNGGSIESNNYPTLSTIMQNYSGHFLNGLSNPPYDNNNIFSSQTPFANNNILSSGNSSVGGTSYHMNQQGGGYVLPENNYDIYSGVLNFTGDYGGNNNNYSPYPPYSAQGGEHQFSMPPYGSSGGMGHDTTAIMQFGAPPQQAVPMMFSGFGNGSENYNYGVAAGGFNPNPVYDLSMFGNFSAGHAVDSPVYDLAMFGNSNAGQAADSGNNHHHMQIGNEYGMNYNNSGSFECEQWYGYSPWCFNAGTSQQNFNQHYSSQAQHEGVDGFMHSLFASNPYGGAAGHGESRI